MNNLAIAYRNRIRGERADNLEQAIDAYQQALQVRTRQAIPVDWAQTMNNLATAYSDRIRGERADNIEQAIDAYQQALQVMTRQARPADHRQTQRNLGHLFFGERRWAEAQAPFEAAIAAGRDLLAVAASEVGRRAEVAETAQLFARSAYCQLKEGQMTKALLTLEQGKTRLLSETLALSGANLELLSPTQQQNYQAAVVKVQDLEAELRLPPETPGKRNERDIIADLTQARSDLNTLLDDIRQEQPDFLPTGLELDQLLGLIPPGGALVAPLVTSAGSAVFVIPAQNQSGSVFKTEPLSMEKNILWLDGFTDDDLQALLIGTEEKPGWLLIYLAEQGNLTAWKTALTRLEQTLSAQLLAPIRVKLTELGLTPGEPLLLMPQGGLGLLPLHALLLEEYPVTIVPSGYALHTAQQRVTEPHRQARSLLAVTNPSNDLPFTPVEGEQVVHLFETEQALELVGSAATLAAVSQQIQGRSHLHFSCHGYYQWNDAMQSGLILANDERLTLSRLMSQVDLSAARLVVLSACETGITEVRQSPDEFLGLPAGFMQAGAPAVISTLWAVNDLSTMLLMEQFYTRYLQDGLDIAEALRQAQLWLRNVTAGALAQRFSAERQALLSDTRMPGAIVSQQFRRFNLMDPEERPFAHPYYWAAFTFSGV